LGRWIFTSWWT